jgi:hypothetical protein
MNALNIVRCRWNVSTLSFAIVTGLLIVPSPAFAGPVVREATGPNAAAIQVAVDTFRNDIGNPNNGNAAGSQAGGRREINWDGGGAAATPTITPSPMTTFANRGASFFTSGVGLEISGAPSAEFGDLNPTYPTIFGVFSSPRLFAALNTNVLDVVFHIPNNTAIPAASNGFGAVFTDVDTATSTRMEFYTPDGELLFERNVLATAGSESLSFLGVSFNAGELVGRVRIISGNAAPGPNETGNLDLVVMDDFLYGEPVPTAGLSIVPNSGRMFRTGGFDLVLGLQNLQGTVVSGTVRLDGLNVTQEFLNCVQPGTIVGGGQSLRCTFPRGFLTPGDHVLQVEINLSNQTRVRNAVRWTIVGNTEP